MLFNHAKVAMPRSMVAEVHMLEQRDSFLDLHQNFVARPNVMSYLS